MSNSKVLFQELIKAIRLPEDREEIESIVYLIMEHEFSLTRSDIMAGKEVTPYQRQSLEKIILRINDNEPVQYVLGETHFFRRKFTVNHSVLIPRQETELLVREILNLDLPINSKILDIGTGSGCIAITLALELIAAQVTATDISKEALTVAQHNADTLKTHVTLLHHDILSAAIPGSYDVIVSNPPYISAEEKNKMKKNVLDYEPHLALFSEHDPLLFYRRIAVNSRKALNKNGTVLVEINEHFGNETLSIFQSAGFSTCEIVKDLQNKDRILIAK